MSEFLNGKLDNQEIRDVLLKHEYSSGYVPSEKLLNDIIEKFWFRDFYNSFISDSFYLDYLTKYLSVSKPEKFNRIDFYRFILTGIVEEKHERSTLQQIALAFEKLQSDSMDPSDYEGLLKAVKAPSNLFSPAWMQKNHLAKITERDGKKYLIWEHHTLTEFLVAEYFLKFEKPVVEFQRFAILEKEGVIAFKSSWGGVLRFLLESQNGVEVLNWLVTFLDNNKENIDDNFSELLGIVDIEVPPELHNKIFKLIYDSYSSRVAWFPVWARSRISKYIREESYRHLKEDIKEWSNVTETFVKRGNVVSIVEGLFEINSELLNAEEKAFWKNILIGFANNPGDEENDVLQRYSLAVLVYYKDEEIIPLVVEKCFRETKDTLLRDEFIQFCSNSSPNSKYTIDVLIEGIKKGSSIYARHGLYRITSKTALDYFLSKISIDEEFLREFFEHESIFDKDGADKELLKTIDKLAEAKTLSELKKLIFTVFRIDNFYKKDESNFIKQVARMISKREPNYIFEILKDIHSESDEPKIDRLVYDSKDLLSILLTKDNIKKYFETFDDFPPRSRNEAQYPIYSAKRLNGQVGEQVYEEAIRLEFIQRLEDSASEKHYKELETKRKRETYESFIKQLEPAPGKFMISVFKYYLKNRKEIELQWQEKDKTRLFMLALDEGIRKIDPRHFRVKILNHHKGNNQFQWSEQAAYFGDILEIVKEIAPEEIVKNRQKVIDYIPYEFSTGSTLGFIENLKDTELDFVNKVMSDKEDDRRYLIPQTYIYLVGEYAKRGCKLTSVKPILKSFVDDLRIQDYYQQSALEVLAYFLEQSDIESKKFLQAIFEKSKDQKLANIANGILISIYKDEDAIRWRIAKLKKPLEFSSKDLLNAELAHEVSPVENELDNMAFGKPLIDLGDEKYLPLFIDLIEYSFKVLEKNRDKKYWDYVNYLWRIVVAFVNSLKTKGSFKPLLVLEDWLSKHATYESSNWLNAQIKQLRQAYVESIGKNNI